MQHVIIGAGPAGVIAAETVRKLDPVADVTIVGDEPEPPYSRMAIPYLLIDQIQEQGTHLRKQKDHFEQLKIDVKHDKLAGLDSAGRTLSMASGGTLGYDKLLLATGSHPLAPPIPGVDSPGVHPCWTLADARAIMQLARPGANVVLMGAGFIGCIILEALASRGVNLTVVEMENRMVPRMLDETAGNMRRRWCEEKGVRVVTGATVQSISSAGSASPKPAAPIRTSVCSAMPSTRRWSTACSRRRSATPTSSAGTRSRASTSSRWRMRLPT